MATSAVYASIDAGLKESAESILARLGITPASAVAMLYSQIVLRRGLPFEPRLPEIRPLSLAEMSREQLDAELRLGVESAQRGTLPVAEAEALLKKELGL